MPSAAPKSPQLASLDGASSVFASELEREEKLLWQSRAGAGAYVMAHMRAVVMGMAFFIVAIVWNMMVSRNSGGAAQLAVVTWLFAGLGAAYALVPLMAYVQGKWFVFYGLTNQRLMILQLYPKRRFESFALATLNRVVPHNVHTGSGSLLIDAPGAISKNPTRPRAGFYGVKYVAKVIEAINTLQNPEAALKQVQAQQQAAKQQRRAQEKAQSNPHARFTPSSVSDAKQAARTMH